MVGDVRDADLYGWWCLHMCDCHVVSERGQESVAGLVMRSVHTGSGDCGERSRDDGTVKHVTGMAFHYRYFHDPNAQET
jgi:hypothetical protein